MISKYAKINNFLSTLNFVLMFIGYQLATSLFLPVSTDLEGISQTVTIPYRAFALMISIIVIFFNLKKKIGKTSFALKILWIYWFGLIIRIFYDTNIRIDIKLSDTNHLWIYILGIILPAMYSVMKSYDIIDFNKALKWVYFGIVLTLILSLFNNSALLMDSTEIMGRAEGNIALNTISFGHLGTMGVVLSLFLLSKQGISLVKKIFFVAVMLLSFFIMLRAGSRSPVLALVVILLFWMFIRGKNVTTGVIIAAASAALIIIFIEPILNFMGNISPVLETRLRVGIFEGDSSGRDILYKDAFQLFLDRPFLGSQFALFDHVGGFIYPHNIIFEAFMALGIFGGLAMIYILWSSLRNSYYIIKNNNSYSWICLILVQQIVFGMLGQFYYNQILNILLVFILMKDHKKKKILTKNI